MTCYLPTTATKVTTTRTTTTTTKPPVTRCRTIMISGSKANDQKMAGRYIQFHPKSATGPGPYFKQKYGRQSWYISFYTKGQKLKWKISHLDSIDKRKGSAYAFYDGGSSKCPTIDGGKWKLLENGKFKQMTRMTDFMVRTIKPLRQRQTTNATTTTTSTTSTTKTELQAELETMFIHF